ncbi:MAG: hypothetical protein LCH46_15010 [Proteobacteria bacterium]|nr:hypothetical protein [Pseudomonadota bacterium]
MATAAKPAIETFSFDGEAVGAAGAAALRKVRSLADSAPPGRLFAAIATLTDTSAEAAKAFEAAGLAELDAEKSNAKTQHGMRFAKRLKQAAGVEGATPLPAFIRRK